MTGRAICSAALLVACIGIVGASCGKQDTKAHTYRYRFDIQVPEGTSEGTKVFVGEKLWRDRLSERAMPQKKFKISFVVELEGTKSLLDHSNAVTLRREGLCGGQGMTLVLKNMATAKDEETLRKAAVEQNFFDIKVDATLQGKFADGATTRVFADNGASFEHKLALGAQKIRQGAFIKRNQGHLLANVDCAEEHDIKVDGKVVGKWNPRMGTSFVTHDANHCYELSRYNYGASEGSVLLAKFTGSHVYPLTTTPSHVMKRPPATAPSGTSIVALGDCKTP